MANTTSRQTPQEAPDPRSHHRRRRPHRPQERSRRRQRQPRHARRRADDRRVLRTFPFQAGDGRRGGSGHPRRFVDPLVGRPLPHRRSSRQSRARLRVSGDALRDCARRRGDAHGDGPRHRCPGARTDRPAPGRGAAPRRGSARWRPSRCASAGSRWRAPCAATRRATKCSPPAGNGPSRAPAAGPTKSSSAERDKNAINHLSCTAESVSDGGWYEDNWKWTLGWLLLARPRGLSAPRAADRRARRRAG